MSITALSFNFVSVYATQAATPAAPAERPAAAAPAETHACDGPRPGGRENRLAQAMMSALRELGLGGAATAASTTDAAAPAAAEPAATAASAVYQFAHVLFQALRQDQRGKSSSDDEGGRVEGGGGHGHRHHHQHHDNGYHRGGQREGYGDLSQRLEALSQTFGTPVAAATTGVAQASTGVAAAEAVATAAAPTVAPAVSSAKNPLLEAFAKLFSALKTSAAATTATSAESDMSGKLRLFLHTLAEALRPDGVAGAQVSQVGGLVNVTA